MRYEQMKLKIADHRAVGRKFVKCLILLFFIVLSSCGYNKYTHIEGVIKRVHVCFTKQMFKYVDASECISDIEYVVLETSPQCLIGENPIISISENYIFVYGEPSCLLFSRQGKFIRSIGSKGQGPREYHSASMIKIDEESGMIFMANTYDLLAYHITGEFVKKLNLSELRKQAGISAFWKITHWKNDLFCSNFNLSSGKEPYRFVIFSLDGDIIKLFPNYVTFYSEIFISSFNSNADIYLNNGQLRFREQLSDTLFRLTDSLNFIPEVIFDLCGHKLPTEKRGLNQWHSTYSIILNMIEVEQYILLECKLGNQTPVDFPSIQQCLYDPKNNTLTACKRDPHAQKYSFGRLNPDLLEQMKPSEKLLPGLINNIDGGLPIWPHKNAHIQNDQQFVTIYQPYEFIQNLTEEYFAVHEIKNMRAHQRLKDMILNLNEEDNPVIVIAKLK